MPRVVRCGQNDGFCGYRGPKKQGCATHLTHRAAMCRAKASLLSCLILFFASPPPSPVCHLLNISTMACICVLVCDETPTTSGRARFYQPIPTLRECRMDSVFLRSKIPCLSTRIMLTLSTRGVRSHSKPNAWAAISVYVRMAATGWVTCQRGANTLDLHTRTGLNSRLAIATRTAAAGAHQFPLITTRGVPPRINHHGRRYP